jgi:hypothetical protein
MICFTVQPHPVTFSSAKSVILGNFCYQKYLSEHKESWPWGTEDTVEHLPTFTSNLFINYQDPTQASLTNTA